MPPAGPEPAIPAGERLQTHALDRSVTGIGTVECLLVLQTDSTAFDTGSGFAGVGPDR
jgi:hypothetical protein